MSAKSFEPNTINLKESFSSLKSVPRFLKEVQQVNPLLFYSNLLCRIIAAFLPLLMLWVGRLIIDEVVLQMNASVKDFAQLWFFVGIEFFLAVLTDLLSRIINYSDAILGDHYSINSSVRIIEKTSEIGLEQLEDSEFYNKLERARQQTTGRVGLMTNVLSQGQDVIVLASLLTGVVIFEPWLILLLIVSIIPTILNEIKFSGTSYSLARSWTEERRELDYLRYTGASDLTAKEVKLFGLSGYIASRFKILSSLYFKSSKKLAVKRARWGSFFNVIGTGAYYGAYVLIIFRTVLGVFTLGDLTFLSGSFNRLRTRMQGFFTRFTSITDRALYLTDYFEFLDMETSRNTKSDGIPVPVKMAKGIKFKNVGFKYPQSENWVLRNVNFELRPGEKIALVGENGAGKTTLIKLLLQFYQATEGEILLDDVPITNFNIKEYQNQFGVIFQDFVRYELTLRENIAIGNINRVKDLGLIENIAEKSLANAVADKLPDGYEQKLGRRFKNGKALSGGEWQKVGIARAYMKDAEILVLDEPTSSLDARAESEAFDRFIKLTERKTAVIISHRFSTVRLADRILVLKEGKVLEMGTHEELIENNGLYSELFKLQAHGYK